MKNFVSVLALACLFSVGAYAAPQNVVETLANSNELNQTVAKSTTVAPSAITVSSSTAARVDSTLATKLTLALGAAYQRAEAHIQNVGTNAVWCGPSLTETATADGTYRIDPGTFWVFKLGKKDTLNCIAETSAGSIRVGGLGWK